jgi:NADH-quinone oxidoreductase subunit L
MSQELLIQLSLVILFLPLVGFLLLIFFGKRLPRQGDWLETGILFLALILSSVVLVSKLTTYADTVIQGNVQWFNFGNVPGIGQLNVDLGVMIDNLRAIMRVVVTLISAVVHLFSIGYMHGDVRYSRYFAFLGIFTFSMLGIVITNNFLMMYVFWELVGLSSYLLIGHWYEKKSASDAAKKAFIVNRIGDIGFFIGIMTLYVAYGTFNFEKIFGEIGASHLPFNSGAWLTAAGILVFCGAIGKSAQFPLHVWLPDAMEGPTPVSALIHAATMVAAGVYLTARTFVMMSADALLFIAYIGGITALLAATIAITQNDIKKVLAYSTVSQLGYMVMALGVGSYTAGFFHLVTHAWFKACLFLGSGSVIHAMHHALHAAGDHHTDPQDVRNMGGLRKTMPITFFTFLIATLAISGVPLTSGFLSKDEILAGTLAFAKLSGHWALPVIGFGVAGLTAFYMFRVVFLTFTGEPKTEFVKHTHESKLVMTLPLIILTILSAWFFYTVNPFGASSGWFYQWVKAPANVVPEEHQFKFLKQPAAEHAALALAENKLVTENETALEAEIHHSHTTAIILSLAIAGLGILLAFTVYYWKKVNADAVAAKLGPVYRGSLNKWYFDEMYRIFPVGFTMLGSKFLAWFDNTVIDGIVNGAAWLTKGGSFISGKFDNVVVDGMVNLVAYIAGFFGLIFRKFQTGKVQTYIIFVLLGVMVIFYAFGIL